MPNLPTGTVTFLFTDVEESTKLFQRYPNAMPAGLARHDAIIRAAMTAHRGHIFLNAGDGFCTAFAAPEDAVLAALDAQIGLESADWSDMEPVRVRMGIHTGPAEARGGAYLASLTLARVQRIMAAGRGGQTLLSAVTARVVRPCLPAETGLQARGAYRLRGLAQPETIFQLVDPDLPANFLPLRAAHGENDHGAAAAPLSQLVRDRLVGRRRELTQLQGHWQAALESQGQLVMIFGEPGVGKSRLAQEFIETLSSGGAAVLRGGSYEYEATTPYLPFVEALRDWVRQQEDATLHALPASTAAELAKLAPEIDARLGPLPPNPPLPPNEERLRLFDHVGRFLQGLAAPNGLLIFLDDLHWADQGTLSLARYLLRSMRNDKVMALAAYREVELNRAHPLAAALVDWNRERLVTRLPLGRFSQEDTKGLLASLLETREISPDFVSLVYRETEGNPFFIEEVIKALIEQEEIYRSGDRWERREIHDLTVPQSIKEAVGRRLDRLDKASADALVIAAALGKQFSFTELAVISNIDEDLLLDGLDEAVAAQLIAPAGDESFVFTHDKIREVLIEEQNPIRRRRLHRRIAEALENLYAGKTDENAAKLAYHFSLSGNLEKTLRYYLVAADCARKVFAQEEALGYLDHAREAADDLGQLNQMVAIDIVIGQVHRDHGTWLLAADAYLRALDRTTDFSERARLKALVGEAYMHPGDQRGLPYLEAAVSELSAVDQAGELAMAWASLGRYHHYATAHVKAIEYLNRACILAEAAGDVNVLVMAQIFLSGAYQHMTRFEESDRWALATIQLGKTHGLPDAEALGYEFLSENAMNRGLWDECIRYARLNHEIGQRIGALDRVAWSGFPESVGWSAKGDLVKARSIALETLDLADRIGEARLRTWLDAHLARLSADLDDWAAAEQYARSGVARAEALGQLALQIFSQNAVAYIHLRREEWTEAVAVFDSLFAMARSTDNRLGALYGSGNYALTLVNVGRLIEAETVLRDVEIQAIDAHAPHTEAEVKHIRGLILANAGKERDALETLSEAVAMMERMDSQLSRAWTLLDRAAVYRQFDRAAEAIADAEQAAAIFRRCGAIGYARRAATLL